MSAPRVALLGLGEAGSRLAVDLAAAGADVRGYDPDPVRDAPGIARAHDHESAVEGCEVVLSVNAATAALGAAAETVPALRPGMVYADLNTASPALKREIAALVAGAGARFADVALLGPVPVRGRYAGGRLRRWRACVRRRARAARHARRGASRSERGTPRR